VVRSVRQTRCQLSAHQQDVHALPARQPAVLWLPVGAAEDGQGIADQMIVYFTPMMLICFLLLHALPARQPAVLRLPVSAAEDGQGLADQMIGRTGPRSG